MTYLEEAIEIEKKKMVKELCPYEYFDDAPVVDDDTKVEGICTWATGCRGLTCKECWNQQVPNSEDKYAEMEQAVRKFKTEI